MWFAFFFFVLNPPWRFGVVGDTQREFWVAKEISSQMRRAGLDFVVHLGDLNTCASRNRWRWMCNTVFRGLKVHWVLGNHELMQCGKYRYRGRYRRIWKQEFNRKETWKTFDHNGWTFMLLDSATPAVWSRQAAWIANQLAVVHKRKGNPPLFVFSHRAIPCRNRRNRFFSTAPNSFCKSWNFRRMDPMPYRWRNVQVHRVLQNHKLRVAAIFHGHWHGGRQYKIDGHRIWSSGGGGGFLAKGHKYHWLLVTVLGPFFWIQKINIKRRRHVKRFGRQSGNAGVGQRSNRVAIGE